MTHWSVANKFAAVAVNVMCMCVCVYVCVLQFMEQESATPLVQFWLTADSFRSQLADPLHVPNIDRDTSDAIAIYERCDYCDMTDCPHSYGVTWDVHACTSPPNVILWMREATVPCTMLRFSCTWFSSWYHIHTSIDVTLFQVHVYYTLHGACKIHALVLHCHVQL